MAERTSYAPGTPNWVDLATPDPTGAKDFYRVLFGWDYHDEPTDRGQPYTMCLRDGAAVAGIMQQTPEMREQQMPAVWTSYVAVASLDEALAEAVRAEGTVMMPAMEVMEAGRMGMIVDPTGAVLALWEAKRHHGAGLVNEHGTLAWNELQTPDVDAAAAFYGRLFGWEPEAHDMGTMVYTEMKLGGTGVAGAMNPPADGIPPHWAVYFAHDDVDAAVAEVPNLGGTVVAPPMDGPPGRWAFVGDPGGAMLAVITLADDAG